MVKIEGALALAVCALCWSLAGVFLKYVDINSFATAGFRSFFAFLTLMAFTRRFPRLRILESTFDAQTLHAGQTDNAGQTAHDVKPAKITHNKINVKATLYLWLSAASYAVTMILFCLANKLTYSANAVLLQYTFPIWIIIFGPLILGEKNTKVDYIAIAGVIVGMLLFFAENIFAVPDGKFKDTQVLGNVLALFSGVSFAGTTIFQRKQSMISPMDNTSFDSFMLAQLITFAFGAPFVFLTSDGVPGIKSLVFLILLGCIQMGFANIAYSIGIKKVRALSASLITMIEPLMNPVWVFVFVREIPGFLCVLGGILIIACVVLREVFNKRKAA